MQCMAPISPIAYSTAWSTCTFSKLKYILQDIQERAVPPSLRKFEYRHNNNPLTQSIAYTHQGTVDDMVTGNCG